MKLVDGEVPIRSFSGKPKFSRVQLDRRHIFAEPRRQFLDRRKLRLHALQRRLTSRGAATVSSAGFAEPPLQTKNSKKQHCDQNPEKN